MPNQEQTEVAPPQLKEPSMYEVVFLNDDYTPMDFVGLMLTDLFGMNSDQAGAVTLSIHETGKGGAGTFTKDVAETKAHQVMENAMINDFPLKVVIEEV